MWEMERRGLKREMEKMRDKTCLYLGSEWYTHISLKWVSGLRLLLERMR